jgi:hypothetical protein
MQLDDMDRIAERHVVVRRAYFGTAALLLCLHLVIGPGRVRDRLVMVGIALFMMCVGFWGARLVLGFQVALHGMTRFVRAGCALGFWFFALGVLWSLVAVALGNRFGAVSAVMCLGWSLGALMTYVKYRSVQPKGTRQSNHGVQRTGTAPP